MEVPQPFQEQVPNEELVSDYTFREDKMGETGNLCNEKSIRRQDFKKVDSYLHLKAVFVDHFCIRTHF